MAPDTAEAPPTQAAKYVTASTPQPTSTATQRSTSPLGRVVGLTLKCLVVASIVVYFYGEWAYFHPVYATKISVTIKKWCHVPLTGKAPATAHPEMVRPVYFILLTALPMLVAAVSWELLQAFHLGRVTSPYLVDLAILLRRKPSFLNGRLISRLSLGELIYVLVLAAGNVFVFAYFCDQRYKTIKAANLKTHKPVSFEQKLEIVGLTFGYTSLFNLAFVFMPVTRNAAWLELLNISYANTIKYHRWLGKIVVVTATVHMALFQAAWVREGEWEALALPCFGCDFALNRKRWMYVFGEIAWVLLIVITLSSQGFVRRRFFNAFYYLHQLFFLAMVFLVLHYGPMVWWFLPSFLVYLVHRAMSVANASYARPGHELLGGLEGLVRIEFKRAPGHEGDYKVGQFLYLNVPAVSKLQWHPFTISSSSRADPSTVTVLIKSLGDWTQQLVQHAIECKQKNVLPTVYVDGFYGASLDHYDEYATVCLIAGGVGATPLFSILEDLTATLSSTGSLQQRVVFVFSFRELALLEQIHPVLKKLRLLDPEEKYFKTHFFLTQQPSAVDLNAHAHAETLPLPTKYADATTKAAAVAFHEPLRAFGLRSVAWVVAFLFAVLLVVLMEYDGQGKLRTKHPKLWALQSFIDIALVYGGALVVAVLAIAERVAKRTFNHKTDSKDSVVQPMDVVNGPASSLTHRDLLSLYRISVGERPHLERLVGEIFEFHASSKVATTGRQLIGTFVSGPCPMKRAVVKAVALVGARHFDIHTEEFKL